MSGLRHSAVKILQARTLATQRILVERVSHRNRRGIRVLVGTNRHTKRRGRDAGRSADD
jgi:hypothetical protein